MIGRKPLSLRQQVAQQVIEALKRDPEKHDRRIRNANQAIDLYRPNCTQEEREKLLNELIYCDVCFGASAEEYFIYGFAHLSEEKRDRIMTDRARLQFYQTVNKLETVKLLNNKYLTYLRFKKYFQREALFVRGHQDLLAFIDFVSKFPKFIMKPVALYGGIGIRMFDMAKDNIAETFSQLIAHKDGVVIEELVKQSAFMNAINDSCLNTVRIMTAYFENGVEIYYPMVRVGRTGTVVDNFCTGGMCAGVDLKTGKISTLLADRFRHFYEKHPDNGTTAKGFQLPQWEQACALVRELAALIPENRVVGWDVAHSENGWVVIEANSCPQLGGQIIAEDGWLPTFEVLQERLIRELGCVGTWNS